MSGASAVDLSKKTELPPAAAAAAASAPSSGSMKTEGVKDNKVTNVTQQTADQAKESDYNCKNKMLVGAAVVFTLATVFFALLAANVIGLDPNMLGGIAASAAIAFATAIAAIIVTALRYCGDEEGTQQGAAAAAGGKPAAAPADGAKTKDNAPEEPKNNGKGSN